jgi:hypothetical protein
MTLQQTVISPGQVWFGQSRDHRWLVKITSLSAQAVEFATLAKGAKASSRVRGRTGRQWMGRAKFLKHFRLEHDA